MDAIQMQFAFQQKLKNDYDIEIDIPTVDIEYYLTEGQRRIVEKYYELFEADEKSRKVLNYLVVSADILKATGEYTDQTGAVPNGVFWELPADMMYCLKEEATLNVDACEDISLIPANWQRVYVKPINLDYYTKNVGNPFKKPYTGMVWRMDTSNSNGPQLHQLITGGTYRVQIYHITYLAYPTKISISLGTNCELPELIHQDIVDEAIRIALETMNTNKLYKSIK